MKELKEILTPVKEGFTCWKCNEEIKENEEVFHWGELENDFDHPAHLYCVIPF